MGLPNQRRGLQLAVIMEILQSKNTKRRMLAQPGTVGGRVTRNRLVMGPLCTMYAAPDGSVTPQLIEYYRARARGGAAIVIVEITFIDDIASRSFHAQLGAQSDMMIPGLSELAEAIKGEGAIAGIQIAHCGSQRVIGAGKVLAPSAIAWADGKPLPQEMSEDDIEQVLESFADAASRLAVAGFDLVELQSAHGYLINTFISPATNKRTDRYGGSPQNRMRFPLELVSRVRARIGGDRLIGVRMNGHDLMPDGYETADYCRVATDFEAAGVDILHISAGTYRAMERRVTPMYLGEAPFVDYAAEIKRFVAIPVIAAGTIHALDTAEAVIADGAADFVAMSRPIFADPELPRKVITGREDEIIPCIRCNTCVSREQAGARSLCAVNPATGYEGRGVERAITRRRVVIAGGGPAGLQSALTAARRGHRVTLIERETTLGGALAVAATLPFKSGLRRYLGYLCGAVEAEGVEILTETDITERAGLLADIDDLVLALGGQWTLPDFPGVEVIDPLSAIAAIDAVGDTVVVIGADLAGAETAWYLAETGRTVTLIDPREGFGENVNLVSRLVIPGALERAGAEVFFNGSIIDSESGVLIVDRGGGPETIRADTVVAARDLEPVASPWAEAVTGDDTRIHRIGEAAGLMGLRWATHTGDAVARGL
jgi:2,4-dienoyl-CoA reductase-like NADH-dependent reductase (Old Yellow Enzyme family)/thioredoxin reductase